MFALCSAVASGREKALLTPIPNKSEVPDLRKRQFLCTHLNHSSHQLLVLVCSICATLSSDGVDKARDGSRLQLIKCNPWTLDHK